jgi:hypothetical protein
MASVDHDRGVEARRACANPVGPYLYDDTGLDAVICPTRGADGG